MAKVVLVIEDDPDQRRLMERVLSAAGYRVVVAVDGEAGLTTARALQPALIILDIMMPRLNGYQACRRLRQMPETAETPVLILTVKQEPADEYWAAEVGANAFLSKPVEVPTLLTRVSEFAGKP
ncbi:MAG: PleD family two-component system response regulator [Gemmatimonadales bacterium]